MDKTAQIPKDLQTRKDLDMRAGDTVRVHVKIQEKGKTRIQVFEGLVISRKHGSEAGGTFAVRKISNGVGVERVFPLYSPNIDKIEVIKRSIMRRSKLYFVRTKVARQIRRTMRNLVQFFSSSADLVKPEEMMDEEVVDTSTSSVTDSTEATPEVAEEKKEE